MKVGASTDRGALAGIYRRAAIIMEQKPHSYACCGAIRTITRAWGTGAPEPEINLFAEMFKPRGIKLGGQWFGVVSEETPDNNEVRILALCFMAAMVEAGDA